MEQGVSNIKIARDEAMSVHQLNETCTFLLLTTLKKIFFSHIYLFSDKITRLQRQTCQLSQHLATEIYTRKIYSQRNIYC